MTLYIYLGIISIVLILIFAAIIKKLRLAVTILAILAASLGLMLSILPLGSIALIPIIGAFILAFIAFKMAQKDGANTKLVKVIFLITIISLALTIYRSVFEVNVVENDIETIEREKQSKEDAIEELEGLEIED
ncbi:FUSC family protein [Pontimicrobium sp. SW4]|uniref:FUSC family protein n=1 Tax=Pontimicrobium sp. SW4 TaxID=3153519 RepID=A0AAU7BW73_9FLAO